jgi:endogenous inhibitor of DNA gyrase (YacG/DUF329 family)
MSIDNIATTINCPTCKKPVVWSDESLYRPFCSKRCQEIDFGEWASESFSIPGTPATAEAIDDDMTQH